MSPLPLTPFPAAPGGDQSRLRAGENEGFVDESVVQAVMLIQSAPFRRQSDPSDLALAADDLDFAGWHAPKHTLVSVPPLPISPVVAPARRSAISLVKSVACELPPVTRRAKPQAPAPKKNRNFIPTLTGILTFAMSSILIATLVAEKDLTFQSIVKKVFHLPTAAEKFEKATATKATQPSPED